MLVQSQAHQPTLPHHQQVCVRRDSTGSPGGQERSLPQRLLEPAPALEPGQVRQGQVLCHRYRYEQVSELSELSELHDALIAVCADCRSEYGWSKYPTAYGRAMNLSRKLRDEYDALLQTYDALVMPTVTQPARRHIPVGAGPLVWAETARE
jgi:hypothetical protein